MNLRQLITQLMAYSEALQSSGIDTNDVDVVDENWNIVTKAYITDDVLTRGKVVLLERDIDGH